MKSTDFGKVDIKDIRPNFKRDIIVIELAIAEDIKRYNLLSITKFREFNVKCSQPVSDMYSFGVINVDPNEEINNYDLITEENFPVVRFKES